MYSLVDFGEVKERILFKICLRFIYVGEATDAEIP